MTTNLPRVVLANATLNICPSFMFPSRSQWLIVTKFPGGSEFGLRGCSNAGGSVQAGFAGKKAASSVSGVDSSFAPCDTYLLSLNCETLRWNEVIVHGRLPYPPTNIAMYQNKYAGVICRDTVIISGGIGAIDDMFVALTPTPDARGFQSEKDPLLTLDARELEKKVLTLRREDTEAHSFARKMPGCITPYGTAKTSTPTKESKGAGYRRDGSASTSREADEAVSTKPGYIPLSSEFAVHQSDMVQSSCPLAYIPGKDMGMWQQKYYDEFKGWLRETARVWDERIAKLQSKRRHAKVLGGAGGERLFDNQANKNAERAEEAMRRIREEDHDRLMQFGPLFPRSDYVTLDTVRPDTSPDVPGAEDLHQPPAIPPVVEVTTTAPSEEPEIQLVVPVEERSTGPKRVVLVTPTGDNGPSIPRTGKPHRHGRRHTIHKIASTARRRWSILRDVVMPSTGRFSTEVEQRLLNLKAKVMGQSPAEARQHDKEAGVIPAELAPFLKRRPRRGINLHQTTGLGDRLPRVGHAGLVLAPGPAVEERLDDDDDERPDARGKHHRGRHGHHQRAQTQSGKRVAIHKLHEVPKHYPVPVTTKLITSWDHSY